MEDRESEVPLPPGKKRVGIIYNLKQGLSGSAPDMEAEYDGVETVNAIKSALETGGVETVLLEANAGLPEKLAKTHIDIAFNIAEGVGGRAREAQIPALLDMLGIPYTGSDATTLCLALDKALTKRLLSTYRVKTPRYALISRESDLKRIRLRCPVIIKPNAEGSSKGISELCMADTPAQLREKAADVLRLYGGSVLAEEYIGGREFTVGVLGNGDETRVFAPMEIVYKGATHGDYKVYSYGVKQDYTKYVDYQCPARLDSVAGDAMTATTRRVYDALGCRDFARVDFRMSEDGEIYFIEINPLPGLAPGYSDYPMLAEFCGISYNALVLGVLKAGAARCGVPL